MIVLDTNVISAVMRDEPDTVVVDWLDAQPPESVWTTSISVYEIHFGISTMAEGRRRAQLHTWFQQIVVEDLGDRILELNSPAAIAAADISARLRSIGRPADLRDVMIAGIVTARRATLVTRNVKHFDDTGVSIVNPWADAAG